MPFFGGGDVCSGIDSCAGGVRPAIDLPEFAPAAEFLFFEAEFFAAEFPFGAETLHFLPEICGMVHVPPVSKFVGNDIIHHFFRTEDQFPRKMDVSLCGAGSPAAFSSADMDSGNFDPRCSGKRFYLGRKNLQCQLAIEFQKTFRAGVDRVDRKDTVCKDRFAESPFHRAVGTQHPERSSDREIRRRYRKRQRLCFPEQSLCRRQIAGEDLFGIAERHAGGAAEDKAVSRSRKRCSPAPGRDADPAEDARHIQLSDFLYHPLIPFGYPGRYHDPARMQAIDLTKSGFWSIVCAVTEK